MPTEREAGMADDLYSDLVPAVQVQPIAVYSVVSSSMIAMGSCLWTSAVRGDAGAKAA